MRKKTLTAIFGTLALISIVPAARAEIASREYVDQKQQKIDEVIGLNHVWDDQVDTIIDSSGGLIANTIALGMGGVSQPKDKIFGTTPLGEVTLYDKLGAGDLNLPTPGAECNNGCMLMVFKDGGINRYAWEPIMRDNNEDSYKRLSSTNFTRGLPYPVMTVDGRDAIPQE